MIPKLFVVTKDVIPEWGPTEREWVRYYLAHSRETVESVVRDRYGPLRHYYSMDRCETQITIEEREIEIL